MVLLGGSGDFARAAYVSIMHTPSCRASKTDEFGISAVVPKVPHVDHTEHDLDVYKGYILVFLGKEYHKYGWVQQYHIGALRNNSLKMLNAIGPDTGFDSIEDQVFMEKLSALLREQDATDELPKTILYCLNPRDNYALTVLAGCFQKEGVKSRVQVGTAWWFY